MAKINKEEIRGWMNSDTGQVYCAECMPSDANEEDLILEKDLEDDSDYRYSCDNEECENHGMVIK